ncbi:GNAT family N-acetyltransferase [Lactobacillus sp. LL6]|uniref:GNAT family N-acetyltransferase n=1 Tax=Lactobacillus sp. LL6 TaxID=2596827 RepID=UPI0011867B26|nr:GNAT family N-acetyltransferase [Lactobacillus sp. LL6]TSO25543.1 GNAT family N-acetyltransferase [Lactobacillus sp. LL6]
MWKIKTFNELNTHELYKILALRQEVFTIEQKRLYQDLDKNDFDAIHVFNYENNEVIAYARVFLEDNDVVTFGRVVIKKSHRGKGLGNPLMDKIMQAIRDYFPEKEIEIEAQVPVKGYYEKYNFRTIGKEFILAGSPHIKMIHEKIN